MNKRITVNLALLIIITAFIFNAGKWGYWLFMLICGWAAIRVLYSLLRASRKHIHNRGASKREYILKMTARVMGLFLITGTILYTFTFLLIGSELGVKFNNAEMIVRSIICSINMFMLDVDSNLLDRLDSYPLLKGSLVVQEGLSFACTVALIGSLVFSRFKAYYILNHKTKITSDKNHLYLFFDINEYSALLAKDIHQRDNKAIIIFVDEANVKEEESNSWNNIVNLFTHRQSAFEMASHSGAMVEIASKRLCNLEDDLIEGNNPDILSMIGVEKVKEFMITLSTYPEDAQLHIFFLAEEEDNNIRSLINLAKDSSLLECVEKKCVVQRIYCHARYNGPNRVIEDLAIRKGLNVEIIDSSHLAIELIKSKSSCQPVRVAELSTTHPTTVTKSLNCLIVGFGEVGRDSFRFLYEYGTFVKYKDEKPEAAKPNITVIDSRMDLLKGTFEANTPAIVYGSDINNCGKGINLLDQNFHQLSFYEKCLSEMQCKELNYIILALGEDDQNITLASNVFNRIRRFRSDMSNLIIMVRCTKDEKRVYMQKIADHYNKGCGEEDLKVIRLFGNPKEIYTYDIIIRDELTRNGMRFLDNYTRIKGEGEEWIKRHAKLSGMEKRKSKGVIYPRIDDLRKLRRQESQDISNALHVATKMWLLKKALGDNYDWESFVSRLFDLTGKSTISGAMENLYYPRLDAFENEVMLNLAILEHVRWNAAHELLGYIPNNDQARCDERARKHNCLKNWEDLDKESEKASSPLYTCDYKSYDFCVVDTSVAISKELLTNNKR